ncbi:Glu-tRNA(Gln) amidotransferase subunit GatE [Candidatus Woesearchaeota archaeon]|nr:Glu-tRNA(Gln) amidotransferase subunit GatE [Candidatus Woesearchaeota archaeon]
MPMDYEKIGLKCGIEIHQQLDSHKLFCNCPSTIRDDKADFKIKRMLRAVAGETGSVDEAALHEYERQKHFIYEGYDDATCLVELDESPPLPMNEEALQTVLQVAKMLNAKVVDEIQVMRKTVVDGSNTSGFQRTALVAMNGFIETKQGKVRIPTICIEEEACKITERTANYDVYNLSRLGIPLIEIGTAPDIKTAEQAKEAASYLGMMLRSTGKVKRGLGTIRQDVNISIPGGARIEIKGAQDLKIIEKLVEYECRRQKELLKIRNELGKKSLKLEINDLTKLLKKSESKVIKSALDSKGVVLGTRLAGFNGFLGKELMPNHRLGTELSDYAKVKAGVKGLFHSDELPRYGITEEDVDAMKKELKMNKDDAFIIIADSKGKAEKALKAAFQRAGMCFAGVPEEVRKANDDGTTSFLRPIPTASRMYPETDVKPIVPKLKEFAKVELIDEKIKRFEKDYDLSNDLATLAVKRISDFEGLVRKYRKIKPIFIVETLINTPKEIKKRFNVEVDGDKYDSLALEVLDKLNNNEIPKQAVIEIIVELLHGKEVDYSRYKGISNEDLEKEIRKIMEENKGATVQALMGIAMGRLKGRAEGKKVMDVLKRAAG